MSSLLEGHSIRVFRSQERHWRITANQDLGSRSNMPGHNRTLWEAQEEPILDMGDG